MGVTAYLTGIIIGWMFRAFADILFGLRVVPSHSKPARPDFQTGISPVLPEPWGVCPLVEGFTAKTESTGVATAQPP